MENEISFHSRLYCMVKYCIYSTQRSWTGRSNLHNISMPLPNESRSINTCPEVGSVAYPGFGQGAKHFSRDFADITKQSWASKVSNIGWGSGSIWGLWTLLHWKWSNMHSPTFPGTFSSKFSTSTCAGTLQKIYFNTKKFSLEIQ